MSVREDIEAALKRLEAVMMEVGKTIEEEPTGFCLDFHNAILGDPYLFGTGYLPTKAVAEALAAMVLEGLNALATARVLTGSDREFGSWVEPIETANESWATVVSAERDEHDSPVYEEGYFGDAWLNAGAKVPFTLTDQERALLSEVREALNTAEARLKETQ